MNDQSRPPMKNAASICGVLKNLLNKKGYEQKFEEYRALRIWDDVVGPQIAARTSPKRIRDGILEIQVDHPVWMQQLQLMKSTILEKINQHYREPLISGLFFRVAPITRSAGPGKPEHIIPADKAPLSDTDRSYIESITQHIKDSETRASAIDLLTKHKCRVDGASCKAE